MIFTFIGLGNPGEEYTHTRHNAGRIMLEYFRTEHDFPEWKSDKKSQALISKGKISAGKTEHTVTLVCPETFMNKSGVSAKSFVTSPKAAERMLVIYDDLDLPFGTGKISFNKSSGGHKGLESIIKAVKTEAFPRLRIGISPTTQKGKMNPPSLKLRRAKKTKDTLVEKIILGEFSKDELVTLKNMSKKSNEALEFLITHGREKTMTFFNSQKF
jgi:peptidyl-tRNA hydrolase, PTH1 family